MKIAVIDSGIDADHPAFRNSGLSMPHAVIGMKYYVTGTGYAGAIERLDLDEVNRAERARTAAFKSQGITFTVYSDGQNIDRAWPLDLVPREMPGSEWDRIEAGLVQRIRALNLFLKDKINPLLGAAGVSAVPGSAREVHLMGLKEDPTNFLLMHGMACNSSGVIGSAICAGILWSFFI